MASWSDERVETVTRLCADGLSAAEIAAEIGGVTRNAVIGIMHRKGIKSGQPHGVRINPPVPRSSAPGNGGGIAHAVAKKRRRIARLQAGSGNGHVPGASVVAIRAKAAAAGAPPTECGHPIDMTPDAPEDCPRRCSLFDLRSNSCRWPVGDPASPEFFFCGSESLDNLPYCAAHARRAYDISAAAVRRSRFNLYGHRPPH
jgi:GcrA cell cycle regulator